MNRQQQMLSELQQEFQQLSKNRKQLEVANKLPLILPFLWEYVFELYMKSKADDTEKYLLPKLKEIYSLSENEARFHKFDYILREYAVKLYNDTFEKALSLELEFLKTFEDKWIQGKYSYVDIVKRYFNHLFIMRYEMEYDLWLRILESEETNNHKDFLEKIYKL